MSQILNDAYHNDAKRIHNHGIDPRTNFMYRSTVWGSRAGLIVLLSVGFCFVPVVVTSGRHPICSSCILCRCAGVSATPRRLNLMNTFDDSDAKWPKHPSSKQIEKREIVLDSLIFNLSTKNWGEGLKENALRSLVRFSDEAKKAVKDCEHQKLVRATTMHCELATQLKDLEAASTRLRKHDCEMHIQQMRTALLPLMLVIHARGTVLYPELLIMEACSGETVAPTVAMTLSALPHDLYLPVLVRGRFGCRLTCRVACVGHFVWCVVFCVMAIVPCAFSVMTACAGTSACMIAVF